MRPALIEEENWLAACETDLVLRLTADQGPQMCEGREGVNVNTRMAPVPAGLEPMFFVRNMRKLEKLSAAVPLAQFAPLFRWGQSYLLTRVQLAGVAKHHWYDLVNMQYGHAAVQQQRMARRPNVSEHARLERQLNVGLPPGAT